MTKGMYGPADIRRDGLLKIKKLREREPARPKIEVGDYITFKAATRWGCGKARRKVVSTSCGICVRYGGWSEFVVRAHEIIKIEKAA